MIQAAGGKLFVFNSMILSHFQIVVSCLFVSASLAVFGGEKFRDSNSLEISVQAPWHKTPFLTNLIESISASDESLYLGALLQILRLELDDEGNEDSEDGEDGDSNDLDATSYSAVIDRLNINEIQKAYLNFNLVNKIHTPRIQSHFDHYKNDVLPVFGKKLLTDCNTDSFGNKLSDENKRAWVLYNEKIYCSPDELYALQTDARAINERIFPFDRVIGHQTNSPLLILYADINSPSFRSMFQNLHMSAQAGKLRFVWRYIPSDTHDFEIIKGYGVDLTLKRTDYLAIDDRNNTSPKLSNKKLLSSLKKYSLFKDISKIEELDELIPVKKADLQELGMKFVAYLLSKDTPGIEKYDQLKLILNNFPKFAYFISKMKKQNNFDSIKKIIEENEKVGASEDSNGIYVNGAAIHKLQFDLPTLFSKVQKEISFIQELKSYGLNTAQSKKLITKFALLSAVKESQFRTGNTLMGNNENRFQVFKHAFIQKSTNRGGVVFLNDIEEDDGYLLYTDDRKENYIGRGAHNMPKGQIPPLRENVHDLIFVLNFGNKEQLRVFFTMAKFFLDRGIPKQIGLLALVGDDPRDEEMAQLFYFLADNGSPKESLAILYKYFESKSADQDKEVFETVKFPKDHSHSYAEYRETLKRFSIDAPSVIVNGVIHNLQGGNWQADMKNQVAHDVKLLQRHIRDGTDTGRSLKSIIYDNAKTERNLRVIPKDPSNIRYKKISSVMYEKSVGFKKNINNKLISGSFWLIGNFNTKKMLDQFIEIVSVIGKSKLPNSMQIRIINTSDNQELLNALFSKFGGKNLSSKVAKDIQSFVHEYTISDEGNAQPNILKLLEENEIQSHKPSIIFNSRYFKLDDLFSSKELESLIEYEFNQRLSILEDLVEAYPGDFGSKTLLEFKKDESFDHFEWFDLFASTVTKTFYMDDAFYHTDVARFDFSSLNMNNSVDVTGPYSSEKDLDILLIIDPIDEYSQKLVSTVNSLIDFPFINIKILLQPSTKTSEEINIKRFYKGVFPQSTPIFNEEGRFIDNQKANFGHVPSTELLTVDIDVPHKWIVTSKNVSNGVDLDNIQMSNYDNSKVEGVYELKHLLIEGYAFDTKLGLPTSGLELEITNGEASADTSVMSTLGYFQLQADAGIWNFHIKSNSKSERHCSLLSASTNRYIANDIPIADVSIPVFSLFGDEIFLRINKNPGYERKNLLTDNDDIVSEKKSSGKLGGFMKSVISKEPTPQKQADINIFTIASGLLYERLLAIMIASVRKNTDKLIKFWIIENYISPQLKNLLPLLAQQYDFEYQLITYKWPSWLRGQREKQRTIWGYKILFLDVIFPQDLDKIIFVDADLIVRTDLQELVQLDLQGAPYGFTPMCDSRKEMEGFRFWKEGYWTNVLQEEYKYHISALYVVDLKKFRSIAAGDRLRSHYQKLTVDPNSLSNLDQDLPNNMQRWIKIFSLPQEWLWCETWCSDDSMKGAKVIDLCNNPLTKESKLDRAKRQIPEWKRFDREIETLQAKLNKQKQEMILDQGDISHDEL